jgi:L-2-hydroxyglutarate oxidase LhgO
VPSLADVSVEPATRGIRAQAMEADGSLVDDFVIRKQGNITHIRNAPSPGDLIFSDCRIYCARSHVPTNKKLTLIKEYQMSNTHETELEKKERLKK